MARNYTLKRRGAQMEETRRRIVEAAVALHSSVGPAKTTVSMVAEKAGVQRHTFYAHFPDEWSLLLACSGLSLERDPLPDATPWASVEDPGDRLRVGLREVYDWYERNADLAGCVLRDAEHHPLVRDIAAMRFGPPMKACQDTLGAGLTAKQRALLPLALSYFTWRALVREGGMKQNAAVAAMARAVEAQR